MAIRPPMVPHMSVLTPLRNTGFRRLFLGMTLGRIGDAMATVALVWVTLRSHSATALGGVLLAAALPVIITSPLAGSVVHRIGVRTAVRLDCSIRTILCLAMAVLVHAGHLNLAAVTCFAVANGSLAGLSEIAIDVATPELIPDESLHQANTLISAVWDLSDLIGPALSGFVLNAAGAPAAFVADALTFVALGVLMPSVDTAAVEPMSLFAGAIDGFRLLASHYRASLLLSLISLFVLFASGCQEVMLPVHVYQHLHASPATYGLIMSACGAATLIGTTIINPLMARLRLRTTLAITLAVRGLGIGAIGLGHSPVMTGTAAVIGTASDGPIYPAIRTAQQRLVPTEDRARVAGARGSLGVLGFPLGNAIGGVLAGHMPTTTGFAILGALHLLPLAALLLLPNTQPTTTGQPA